MKKKFKTKISNFFFQFFFQNPEFWYGREPILVKKNDTLGCEKKKLKKKFQNIFFQNIFFNFFFKIFFQFFFQNFFFKIFFKFFFSIFFFKTSESWYGREPILVKKNDTLECEKKIKKKFWILFSIFFSKPLNFGMVANQSILVKKNDTLGCEKKFKKKFQFFFLNFFFKTPEFWYGREPILVKKNYTLGCEKKFKKKNFKIFFFKIFFSIFFQNFFSIFFSKPLNFGMVANQFRWKKTPSVVTVGLCWNKPAITPKWFNSLDTNSRISCKFHV